MNANHTKKKPGVYETVYGNAAEYYGPDEPAKDLDMGEEIPVEAIPEVIDFSKWIRSLDD